MPFLVKVLAEDVALWEKYIHDSAGSTRNQYRPRMDVFNADLARVTLRLPVPIEWLTGQVSFCYINVEKSFMSKATGTPPRILIDLEKPNRAIEGSPRLLRLRIERIEPRPDGPPRVILAEL
jgi:hypothetical protein